MEINFLMSAHERIISCFKSNKRFIEKELSQLFYNCKKLKKSAKDNVEEALNGFDELIQQIDKLKEQYLIAILLLSSHILAFNTQELLQIL